MTTNQFNPASFVRAVSFPAVSFKSFEEFQSYSEKHQSALDNRYAYEVSMATHESFLTHKGTCASCLRPATFASSTQGGKKAPDGRTLPNWREEMRCDCEDRFIGRHRAVIHFLMATVLAPWTRMLLFGPTEGTDRRLASLVEEVTSISRLERQRAGPAGSSSPVLSAPSAAFHAVVSQDYLQWVPPLHAALAEILRVLVPGGRFIFTIPFHHTAPTSELVTNDALSLTGELPVEFRGSEHKVGWDLLSLLKRTGFREAAAYLYWSEELGYLGSTNFIFKAVK